MPLMDIRAGFSLLRPNGYHAVPWCHTHRLTRWKQNIRAPNRPVLKNPISPERTAELETLCAAFAKVMKSKNLFHSVTCHWGWGGLCDCTANSTTAGSRTAYKTCCFCCQTEFAHHEVDRSIRGNASCSLKRKIWAVTSLQHRETLVMCSMTPATCSLHNNYGWGCIACGSGVDLVCHKQKKRHSIY